MRRKDQKDLFSWRTFLKGLQGFDFDNDGKPHLYSAAKWSAAGIRVSQHERFHEREPEKIRALHRQHARGNSLYRRKSKKARKILLDILKREPQHKVALQELEMLK